MGSHFAARRFLRSKGQTISIPSRGQTISIPHYLIGASLKDLGKKCFGFTKMDSREIPGLVARV